MKKIISKKLYSAKEISELLGLSIDTTRKLFREEKIKGVKIGREWHATEQAIDNFIDNVTK